MTMRSHNSNKVQVTAQDVLAQVIAAGRVTHRDYLQLISMLLSDRAITDGDRREINRILESVQLGKVKLVD